MENHHFLWVNPLFLWPFSIANCWFTRGYWPADFGGVPYWLGCGCGDPPPAAGAVGWWQVVKWVVNYVRKHVSIIEDWPCIVDRNMLLRKIVGQDMHRYYENKQLVISNGEIQTLSRQARNARPCRHRLWEVPSPVSLGQLHRDSENGTQTSPSASSSFVGL